MSTEEKEHVEEKEQLKVTSLSDIRKAADGEIIELPGWKSDPVFFHLRRPQLTTLVRNGKIPNALMSVVESLFDDTKQKKSDTSFGNYAELLHIIAEAALVKPGYEDVKDILTDEQLLCIYQYTQGGLAGLRKFRLQQDYAEQIIAHSLQMERAAKRTAKATAK